MNNEVVFMVISDLYCMCVLNVLCVKRSVVFGSSQVKARVFFSHNFGS